MPHFNRLILVVAVMAGCFIGTHGQARASSEICPARVGPWESYPADTMGVVYGLVLEASSARSARGTIVVATNAGYFTFAFPDMPFVLDHGQYRSASALFYRDRYVTAPLYVRFPASVTGVTTWWITNAQTSGETFFGWDGHGMVACSLAPLNKPQSHKDVNDPYDDVKRVNPLPYDLTTLPAQATIAAAVATNAPGDVSCAVPFANATAYSVASPRFPQDLVQIGIPYPYVTTLVQVFIGTDGALVDEEVFQPSGYPSIDRAALAAAAASRYNPATAFCKPTPGEYLFRADFRTPGA